MELYTGFEDATEKIDALINLLKSLHSYYAKHICEEAVSKAGEIVSEEQHRRVREREESFEEMLREYHRFVRKTGYYEFRCGFSTEEINEHIELLILEYGRPGTGRHALQRHGWDKLGRKIGVIQPSAYIRGSWFATSDKVKKFLGEYIFNEVRKVWVKKNG